MLNRISVGVLNAVETILNRYIMLNPEEREKLTVFNGCMVELRIIGSSQVYFLKIVGPQIIISTAQETLNDAQADVVFTGPPLSLLRYFLNVTHDLPEQYDIQISKDVELGKRLRFYFAQFSVDWEEQLSHLTGDVIAHQIGNAVRNTKTWSEKTLAHSKLNLKEYLQEEIRLLPRQQEMGLHSELIDDIDREVKQLEQRVNQIKA